MNKTDIHRLSQTLLIPLFAEVCGYSHLRNLDHSDQSNYPGIDLADDVARIAIQITATSNSEKIKKTLRQFMKNDFYSQYDRLIVYILTEKQRSYSGHGYDDITQGRFDFNKDTDIWDYRDILRVIAGFGIQQTRIVEGILQTYFGTIDEVERCSQAATAHCKLGNYEEAANLYSQALNLAPRAEFFIYRGQCRLKIWLDVNRRIETLHQERHSKPLLENANVEGFRAERDEPNRLTRDLRNEAYKDFSDAIVLSENPDIIAVARKERLHMQASPFEFRGNPKEDIHWLKEHLEKDQWGEIYYLEALSYGFDTYLFQEDSCAVANCAALAVSCLDKAIALGFDGAEVYLLRSQAHHGESNFGSALADVNRVIGSNSDTLLAEALSLKGNLLTKLHRFDQAFETYEEYRRRFHRNPDYVDALFRIEEVLICGYALHNTYVGHDNSITLQISGHTFSVTLTSESTIRNKHPRTIALLRDVQGALAPRP